MNNADMPVMDESDIHGQHYGLTKREHFAVTLPHLDIQLGSIGELRAYVGRDVNADDVDDMILAAAQFEARVRVIRANALLAELEK